MTTSRRVRLTLFAVCLSLASLGAWAQAQPKKDFERQSARKARTSSGSRLRRRGGQDVDLAKVKSTEYVIDLGSGAGAP